MIELPNTKEIINLLLSFGEHIDKTIYMERRRN